MMNYMNESEEVTCPVCGVKTKAIYVLPAAVIQTMAPGVRKAVVPDQKLLDYYKQFSLSFPEEAAFQLPLDEKTLSAEDFKEHIVKQDDGYYYYKTQTDIAPTRRVSSYACSQCHSILPPVLFQRKGVKLHITLLIGATEAGKTVTTVSLSRSRFNAAHHDSFEYGYYAKAYHELCNSGKVPDPTQIGLKQGFINRQFNLYHYNPVTNTLHILTDTPGEVFLAMINLSAIVPQELQLTALFLMDCNEQSENFDETAEQILSYAERYKQTFTGGVILNFTKADLLDKETLQAGMLKDIRGGCLQTQADLAVARRQAMNDALMNNPYVKARHPKISRLYREMKSVFSDVPFTALFSAALGSPTAEGYLVGRYSPLYMDALLSELIWR